MVAYQKISTDFETWLVSKTVYSKVTVGSYRRIVKNFLAYLASFDILRLKDVDKERVVQFTHFNEKKRYAQSFITMRLAALNLFFTWAQQHKYCADNPLIYYKKDKIKPKNLNKGEGRVLSSLIIILSKHEQKALLGFAGKNEFMGIRNKAIMALILASGLFAEEIISVTLTDLNLKKGMIAIRGEDKRERLVQLDRSLCEKACQNWLQERKHWLGSRGQSALFLTRRGEPLSKRMLYKMVSEHMVGAGVEKDRNGSEVLRQTAIWNMFNRGMTLEDVQQNTGIKSLMQLEKYRDARA